MSEYSHELKALLSTSTNDNCKSIFIFINYLWEKKR